MWRRRRAQLIVFLSSLFLSNLCLGDQTPSDSIPRPELRATRINPRAPVIDGDLNDEMWQHQGLDLARNFRQMQPDEGKPASESTLVAVVYDDDAMYFAFWNYDSQPDKIKRQVVRRDRYAEADFVTVRLDSYHDHKTGYRFELNAAGVQRDMRLYDDLNSDMEWDGVWEGATKMQPWGWSAEIRIPYHCLRFITQEQQVWGCNVTRYISRKAESSWWAFSPSSEGGHVSTFGHLTGLTGIQAARHFEVLPYAVSRYENEPKRRGNSDGRDYLGNVGFDVKYGISSNLTLDATINPDFGQVELDQPVLNLTAFETVFTEKRPFFLEGANMYNTPFSLLYSRRIGRSPTRGVEDPRFGYYIDYPKATTILGAGKMTGRFSSGTSVSFLNAVTGKEMAEYVAYTADTSLIGDTRRIDTVRVDTLKGLVEPQASYSALRVQQDLFRNSTLGLLLTHTGQDQRYPVTTGGMDWRLFTKNSNYGVTGQVIFSRLTDKPTGFGMTTSLEKTAGKHWSGNIGATVKDPYLSINRLGITSRNNMRRAFTWVQYRTEDDWFIFRNTFHNFNFSTGGNYTGDNLEKQFDYNNYLEFINNWSFGGGITYDFPPYDDMETRGRGPWRRPASLNWWANLSTDARKMITVSLNPGSGSGRNGSWWAHYTGLDFRPRSNMEYSLGVNYVRTFGATIWTENRGDSVVFADLDQDEVSLNLSASLMLRRNLSFQLSGQGYITALDYRNYRQYLGDDDYLPVRPGSNNQNFSALNSTMIVRWEYLPGSTLYFVWTRSRSEVDAKVNDLILDRDLDRLFSRGSNNVWLVKASYWWNI